MLSRLFILLLFTVPLLYAEPTLAQVKQAVTQNPALLETPQAKAMMKEKGVSASEVKQKLAEDTSSSVKESSSESTVDNTVDTSVTDDKSSDDTLNDKKLHRKNSLAKRVNPFKYKTNQQIRIEENAKQQDVGTSKLRRYSLSFYANKNKLDSSSLPTPDDYIMSVGDRVGIHIYGDRDEHFSTNIKNDGTIDLNFIGPVKLGGMDFATAKKHLISQLKNHYKMSDFNVNIDKYSTIQVTLIGDVKYPGLYNLSSFATVKDLLIVAKGVRKSASVRNIVVKRNSKVIAKLDFYDLLFKGKNFGRVLLKHGDIVQINKAKKIVSIDGYVNNAAKFELKGNEDLRKLIEYAGGLKPDASKSEIKIRRFDNNEKIKTFKVSYKESKNFKMKDGDSVYIYPLDFTAKNSVNLYGNVIRPGTYSLNHAKTLHAFFKSSITEGIKKFFLPNTDFEYGVIRRYTDDLQYTSKSFNLANVINGTQKVELHPSDQVFIFNMSDIYSNAYVATKGTTLIHPGKLQYVEGMTIQDAVNASGIDGVLDDKVKVTTYATENFMPKTTFYSLKTEGNKVLSPYDEVEVYDYYATHILEPVTITGEVVKPTKVYYEKGMSVADLLDIAGGFNKTAYTKSLSILRYYVDATQTRQQKVIRIDLNTTKLNSIKLEPYDVVRISKIIGWGSQDYETVTIKGEVHHPVTTKYGEGMSLDDLVVIASGLTKRAYTKSLSILRYYVDATQTRQQKVINIDLNNTALSSIKLEPYDEVTISKILGWDSQDYETVSITGEVHQPKTVKYGTGLSLGDLVIMAGGVTKKAYNRNVEIVRYTVDANETRQRKILKIDTENRAFSSIALKPYDEVRIFKIPKWNERRSVVLSGEVKFPGVYSIENGEKLSSVIERAGGYTKEAFISGAVFTRESIRKRQQKEYNRALSKIKRELALYNAMPANAKNGAAMSTSTTSALDTVIVESKQYEPIGRVSIELQRDVQAFQDSKFDLVLKDQDKLFIPSQIDTVTVFGEVFNAASFVFDDEKSIDEYINMASGLSRSADASNIYVIHANGVSEPVSKSWFTGSIEMQKGDTIVVPLYIKEINNLDLWDSVAKVLSSFALTAAAINSLGVI